jgi:hypothetical protein
VIFLKYYWNPLVLSIGMAAYYSPVYLPIKKGEPSGMIAVFFGLWLITAIWAWAVAFVQLLKAIDDFRHGGSTWKHDGASALWTYLCYGIFITLVWNGYFMAV